MRESGSVLVVAAFFVAAVAVLGPAAARADHLKLQDETVAPGGAARSWASKDS